MSKPDELRKEDLVDASVSATYKDAEHPTVPNNLDQAVLGLAASEVGGKSWLEVANLWLRPATYVATLSLCIVLLINLDSIPDIRAIDDITPAANPFATPESVSNQSTALRNAAEQAARQLQNAESNDSVILDQMPQGGYGETSIDRSDRATSEACSIDQRTNADNWHACIAELQAAGADDVAALEIELLREAFPAYVLNP